MCVCVCVYLDCLFNIKCIFCYMGKDCIFEAIFQSAIANRNTHTDHLYTNMMMRFYIYNYSSNTITQHMRNAYYNKCLFMAIAKGVEKNIVLQQPCVMGRICAIPRCWLSPRTKNNGHKSCTIVKQSGATCQFQSICGSLGIL